MLHELSYITLSCLFFLPLCSMPICFPYKSEQIKLSMMQLWHLDIIDCTSSSDLHKILKFDVEFLKGVLFINTVFLSYL